MRYHWSLKRFWWHWLKSDIKRWYYSSVYKFNMGANGTMMPDTGKGKYVSVYRKGDIIQIIDESGKNDEIRIIPYQPNHGIMVERLKNGKLCERNLLDIEQLNKNIIFASNIEKLTGRKEQKNTKPLTDTLKSLC